MVDQKSSPGRVKQITAVSNPVIKSIKALAQKKNRDAENVFLAEGLKLITDAFLEGWSIHTLIFASSFAENERLQEIAAKSRAKGTDILEVNEKVLSSITRRDNPQMVVGVMEQRWASVDNIEPSNNDVWVALDRIRDPGNLGTIIRTVDSVGAKGVILVGETTDPYSIEAVRATMGSIFNIEIARADLTSFKQLTDRWQGNVVGTHLSGAVDYRQINYDDKPTLLLMGNEQQGLPQELTDMCNHLAYIPMAGKADSLNLAISTGIMLYEIRRTQLSMGGT